MGEVLQSQSNCLKDKCLGANGEQKDFSELQNCVKNCEAGLGEILTMQTKHAEVARLTYAKNIARCETIHGSMRSAEFLEEDGDGMSDLDNQVNVTGLAHCISHNTDKVDRRFFGYYSTQRNNLVHKYSYV